MSIFKNVISLGFFCSVALEMKRIHRRKASFPFDWCISEFAGVLKLIENGFSNFLDYNQMKQNKDIPKYYKNSYGIQFYHDFNEYEALCNQLPNVKKKYDRRIKRFYRTVKHTTLFIRYIENEDEISFILNNSYYINSVIKKANSKNKIIFIGSVEYPYDCIADFKYFYVSKDNNDTVAREFLDKNTELLKFIEESVPEYTNKLKYNMKYNIKKIKNKIKRVCTANKKDKVQQVYTHYQQYE